MEKKGESESRHRDMNRLVIELGMIHHFLYLTFLPWFYIDFCISPILICILVFI